MTESTVTAARDGAPDSGRFYGWDWTATTHEGRPGIVNDVVERWGAHVVTPGRGLQGWSQSVDAFDGDGYKIGSVYYGAAREDVHVLSTSAAADSARRLVLDLDPQARTARVDTRVDSLVPFEDLAGVLEDAAGIYGSQIVTMEKRVRGESQGRTVYLGAPTSAVRVRLYEKWLESPGEYVEGTNRVEVQLRPQSKVKGRVSSWSPAETFCASKVTQHLAAALGASAVPASSLHVAKGTPDLERTLDVMGQQYGPAVARWLSLSAGDVDTVLDRLLRSVPDERTELAPF